MIKRGNRKKEASNEWNIGKQRKTKTGREHEEKKKRKQRDVEGETVARCFIRL